MRDLRLLPLKDVERRLGVTRWTLYEMIKAGKLPAVKLESGHYRVREEVVDKIARGVATFPQKADVHDG